MAGDIEVRITGETKELRRARIRAEIELRKLERAARKAGREGGDSLGTDIVKGASKANVAIKLLGGVIGGAVLTGALGVAAAAANALNDKLVDLFTESKRTAEEAAAVFQGAFSSVFTGIQTDVDKLGFSTKNQLLDAVRDVNREISDLEERQKVKGGKGEINLGATLGGGERVEQAKVLRGEEAKILATLKVEADFLKKQLSLVDAITRARTRLTNLGAGSDVKVSSRNPNIDGGSELADPNGRPFLKKDLAVFESMRIARVAFVQQEQKLIATLQRQRTVQAENSQLASEAADIRMRELQSVIDLEETLTEAQEFANAQFDAAISSIEVFGSEGIDALASIIVGFEKLEDIGNIVSDVIRGLVKDLIVAAAKAALLTVLFPSSAASGGGFKGLFKGFLGLTPFAKGGIVTGPTPALVGEAGPEAIIPLSQLGNLGSQRLEVVPAVLPSGDILVGLREANNRRDGRGGRISI